MLKDIKQRLWIACMIVTTMLTTNQMEAKAWWSCMYPKECFQYSVCSVVDGEGKKKENTKMTEDDYEKIKVTSRFKTKFYLLGDGYDKFFGKTLH